MSKDRRIRTEDGSLYEGGKIPESDYETALKVLRTLKFHTDSRDAVTWTIVLGKSITLLNRLAESHNERVENAAEREPSTPPGPAEEGGVPENGPDPDQQCS